MPPESKGSIRILIVDFHGAWMGLTYAKVCLDDREVYAPAAAIVTGAGHYQGRFVIGCWSRVSGLDGPPIGAYYKSSLSKWLGWESTGIAQQ
jgi:hypothetical protein